MTKKTPSLFTGQMDDWELATTKPPSKIDAADRPLSKPDRVAAEQAVVVEKYGRDKTGTRPTKKIGNPHVDANVEHAELVRAKKKGALDNDTNAKTFVVSANNKIVGSQG